MTDTMKSEIRLGDCLEVMRELPDASIDCVITDPPYQLSQFMHKRNTNLKAMRKNSFAYAGWDNMKYEDWRETMRTFLNQCSRTIKRRGALIIFMSVLKVAEMERLATEAGFYYKTTGVWHKTNPMPRNMNIHFVNSTESWMYLINKGTSGTFNNEGRCRHDFLESPVCPKSERTYGSHPTQKPIAVLKELISVVTNPNDMVVDPFMGVGSTCVAAAQMGRRYFGIETDKEYYDIANRRLKDIAQ